MSDDNTPKCLYETDAGPCQRTVLDGGFCYLHDPDQKVPENHGAPEGNFNAMKHGLHVNRRRCLKGFEPGNELLAILFYEDYLKQSVYDFEEEYEYYRTFSEEELPDNVPDYERNADGSVHLEVAVPQEHIPEATYLFNAAVDQVKAIRVDTIVTVKNMTQERVIDSRYLEDRDEWVQIVEEREHPLNLPLDRLHRGIPKLLEKGGVLPLKTV